MSTQFQRAQTSERDLVERWHYSVISANNTK